MSKYRELNIERLKALSEEVRKAVDALTGYADLSETEIISNKTVLNAIKYNFIVAIQAVIDICHHIVARLAGKVPDEYGECFLILKDMGYIDAQYAVRLKSMAGFRNILIHLYHEVDDRRVVKHLKEDISVIEDFLKVVKRLIENP
ncbi:hypothetical protein JZK55_11380 [Dissulfurispira thermophila]|uniref:DUF86 domain-containing protein n=2 Tax=root TaxID=1 RepID=A0A7G1H2Q7_9BACT|nr:DUF86 domain-containing protein [Dissulfurispira thermophila]BCB96216.1 hypothetical protein JZK55_11380 [Dissulfurispira thermophila]